MGLTDVTPDLGRLAVALRLADSAYPSGAFNSSWGLEGAIADALVTDAGDVERFLNTLLDHRFATFDRPMMRRAVRTLSETGDRSDDDEQSALFRLAVLDREIEAWTLVDTARTASRRSGTALLSTAAALGVSGAAEYRAMVLNGAAPGHQLIAQALVWTGEGLDAAECELLCGWQLVNQIASAALRLGVVGHIDGQRLRDSGQRRVSLILSTPPPAEPSAFTPLADMAMANHARRPTRMFSC
ncbi:MAG: urease accessory protein UreF [Acidimicrobiia bacterium]